jgi:hypothetical protein
VCSIVNDASELDTAALITKLAVILLEFNDAKLAVPVPNLTIVCAPILYVPALFAFEAGLHVNTNVLLAPSIPVLLFTANALAVSEFCPDTVFANTSFNLGATAPT